jgi:phosphoribosylglycinamide formyltransferase-1
MASPLAAGGYGVNVMPKRVAILGSGRGTNARAICSYAAQHPAEYSVSLVVSTNATAGICSVASTFHVPVEVLDYGTEFGTQLADLIRAYQIDVLVLAGFLKLLPSKVIDVLQGNVLNIHPALLPEFGGKGMYGIHVHRAVIASKAGFTGATVHVVSDVYDDGAIVAQRRIQVPADISPEELQLRVQSVEHDLFPEAIAVFIRNR